VLLAALSACEPDQTPLPQNLSDAYADLLAYRDASRGMDSVRYAAGVDSVLAAHAYDRAAFLEALRALNGNADQVNGFFDSSLARLMPKR